jgi:protein-arginine kinase
MRVRTGRNLKAFPLPGGMSKQDRCDMENVMVDAFSSLIKDPAYGGRYVSLTPGHRCEISEDEYKDLVKAHIMFKDMADDPYLASAGIASDWPYGRGCYISEDKQFIVWVGEEDHLRIMCMKKGTLLNEVFDRLSSSIKTMDKVAAFAYHLRAISIQTGILT